MTGPELAGRVILVTCASSGIGAAAARELHRRGATVHRQGGYYSNRRPGLLNPQALSGPLARQLWEQTEQILATAADET